MTGNLTKRSKNSWTFRYDEPTLPGEPRKQKSVTLKGTKKQVDAQVARIIHQVETGTYIEPSKQTLGQYLDDWFETAQKGWRPSTTATYRIQIEKHLKPALGAIPLARLGEMHIDRYYAQKHAEGLSANTVALQHTLLFHALRQAVRWKLIPSNPADVERRPAKEQKQQSILDFEQCERLLEAAAATPLFLIVVLAADTGMRIGEIMGLRWADVELREAGPSGVIHVKQQLVREGKDWAFRPLKTDESRRDLILAAHTAGVLLRHKGQQAEQRLRAGAAYQDQGLVCAALDGSPAKSDTLRRHYYLLLEKTGLPRVRIHDLRHTHISHLLADGEHIKVVSARAGHASVAFTLQVYGHLLKGMDEGAAAKVDARRKPHREAG